MGWGIGLRRMAYGAGWVTEVVTSCECSNSDDYTCVGHGCGAIPTHYGPTHDGPTHYGPIHPHPLWPHLCVMPVHIWPREHATSTGRGHQKWQQTTQHKSAFGESALAQTGNVGGSERLHVLNVCVRLRLMLPRTRGHQYPDVIRHPSLGTRLHGANRL